MATYTKVAYTVGAGHPTTSDLDQMDVGINAWFGDMATHRSTPLEHQAPRIATGTYTGNGGNGTTITVGWQPLFVYIYDATSPRIGCWLISGFSNYKTVAGVTPSGTLVGTGFTVWNGDTNTNAHTYAWTALG